MRLLTTIVLGTGLVAQGTYLVNQANPPGTHFTSLAVATASVPSGSRLLVYPGTYAAFTIDAKALTIQMSPYVTITPDAQVKWCRIQNTAANQDVTISRINAQLGGWPLLSNCSGPVLLLGSSTTGMLGSLGGSGGYNDFTIDSCSHVTLREAGMGGLVVQDSNVTFESCSLVGLLHGYGVAEPAVFATNSSLTFVASSVRGSNGYGYFGGSTPGAPAIAMTNSSLRFLGSSAQSVAGGNPGAWTANQPPFTGTGTVRIDPAIALVGEPSPATVTISTQPMAWLTSTLPTYGNQVLSATRYSTTNNVFAIVLGWPEPPSSLPGILDALCLDPNSFHVAAVGAGPTPSGLSTTVPIPSYQVWSLTPFVWQALDLPATGPWQLSNASSTLIL